MTNGLSLAKSVGAKVTVIIVEEPFNWQSVSDAQAQQALEELFKHAEQIKKHAASVLKSRGRCGQAGWCALRHNSGEGRVSLSGPLQRPATGAANIIVMASHGRSGLSAIVLGSVTNKVLTHTKIPVLVWSTECAGLPTSTVGNGASRRRRPALPRSIGTINAPLGARSCEGAVIAGMGHKKQKKERRRPGSQHAEEHRSARAAPEARDLPLVNIQSQRDCTAQSYRALQISMSALPPKADIPQRGVSQVTLV